MSEILAGLWPPAPKHIEAQVDALETEREAASQDYADLLKDYRALRKALEMIATGDVNYPERTARAALENK
jgi:hypothetical protein